jgi:hypothetical protein
MAPVGSTRHTAEGDSSSVEDREISDETRIAFTKFLRSLRVCCKIRTWRKWLYMKEPLTITIYLYITYGFSTIYIYLICTWRFRKWLVIVQRLTMEIGWRCPYWINTGLMFTRKMGMTNRTRVQPWKPIFVTHKYLVGGLEHLDYFSIYWECHHPNWLSYFSEG